MLERHGLAVNAVESAEEALDYLKDHQPDVVFMDHMMPGMDGMEALRSIKGNPETVMIPVVMYTAKEGRLHVGQARALGAIGILSKQLRPGELFEVLRSLGLVDEKRAAEPDTDELVPDERAETLSPDTLPEPASISLEHQSIEQVARATAAYLSNSAAQIQERRLMEEQVTQLRQSVSQLRQEIAEFTSEQQRQRDALPLAVADKVGAQWAEARNRAPRVPAWRRFGTPFALALALLLAVPAAIGFGVLLSDRENRVGIGERGDSMVDALGWALSDEGQFRFGEVVFSDQRLASVRELVSRLSRLGFSGTVRLESFVGRPCLAGDPIAGYRVLPDDSPLDECDSLGVSDTKARELGALASADFTRYVDELGAGDSVRIEVVSRGHDAPKHAYPEADSETRAGQWNQVAIRNNRVVVSLIPH